MKICDPLSLLDDEEERPLSLSWIPGSHLHEVCVDNLDEPAEMQRWLKFPLFWPVSLHIEDVGEGVRITFGDLHQALLLTCLQQQRCGIYHREHLWLFNILVVPWFICSSCDNNIDQLVKLTMTNKSPDNIHPFNMYLPLICPVLRLDVGHSVCHTILYRHTFFLLTLVITWIYSRAPSSGQKQFVFIAGLSYRPTFPNNVCGNR